MLGKALYYALTFAESGLSLVGIRSTYAQPHYRVLERPAPEVEIRAYDARVAAETTISGDGDGAAFGRLFRYIAGGNAGDRTIAMSAPVEERTRIAMTTPVAAGDGVMRFFLPASFTDATAPRPADPAVRIVALPPQILAVIRFSGSAGRASRAANTAALNAALAPTPWRATGPALFFGYDPPFTPGFLRRNEIARPVTR